MTRKEYDRLNELDRIIAYNNKTDCGRTLTEEERREHTELFTRLINGEEVEENNIKAGEKKCK